MLTGNTFDALLERSPQLLQLGRLTPALEVWTNIQSRPESGLAIAALGKRDISHDIDLPVPLWKFRPGRDTRPLAIPTNWQVSRIFDQHCCIDIPADCDLAVGDLVGFGVSHPCTTFDKWRAVFMVDNDYRVTDILETLF